MKKLILIAALAVALTDLNAQRVSADEVPAPVTAAFAKQFPEVKNIDWSKAGENYEAQYKGNEDDHIVTLDGHGVILSTKEKITRDKDLHAGIKDYVSKNYPGKEIKKASKVTSSAGVVTYEIEINEMNVTFDSNGAFMSAEKKIG